VTLKKLLGSNEKLLLIGKIIRMNPRGTIKLAKPSLFNLSLGHELPITGLDRFEFMDEPRGGIHGDEYERGLSAIF